MARQFGENVQAEQQFGQGSPSTYVSSGILFRPRPHKTGLVETNKLFFNLFRPEKWSFFSGKGLFGENPALGDAGVFYTYYIRLHGHYIEQQGEDGPYSIFVICPKQMNAYLRDRRVDLDDKAKAAIFLFGQRPEFPLDSEGKNYRCPYCEHASVWWDRWTEAWKASGYDRNARFQLKKDDKARYESIKAANPNIKKYEEEASKWTGTERYVFQVYDVSKALREAPLDEGEEGVSQQIWMGPKRIFDSLEAKRVAGYQFYNPANKLVVAVAVDTTAGEMQFKKYTSIEVMMVPPGVPNPFDAVFSPELVAYLENDAAAPDPSDEFAVWTWAEANEKAGFAALPQAVATAPQQQVQAPVQPVAPVVSPPVPPPPAPIPPAPPVAVQPPAPAPGPIAPPAPPLPMQQPVAAAQPPPLAPPAPATGAPPAPAARQRRRW